MIKTIIAYWFKWSGWKFTGTLPKRMKKSILVAAPHTSRKDFLLAVGVAKLAKFHSRILVDKRYFFFPLGFMLDRLGAQSYDPNDPQETERVWVNKFNDRRKCSVVMIPEVTRDRNDEWDTTFYKVALKTESPIVMVALDYRKKEVKFHSHFYPSANGDMQRDLDFMRNWFSTYRGKVEGKGVHRLEHSVKSSHS